MIDTSENRWTKKPTEIVEAITQIIEVKRAGSSEEMELLPIEEEELDDLGVDPQGSMADNKESAMSEEEDETTTIEKSSPH